MQGSLSVERMCHVAAVSRASFYRWLEPSMPAEEEMEVRCGDPGGGAGASATLRLSAGDAGAAPSRHGCEPQARCAADERRQPVGNPATGATDRYQHPELHHVGGLMDARNQTRLEAMS